MFKRIIYDRQFTRTHTKVKSMYASNEIKTKKKRPYMKDNDDNDDDDDTHMHTHTRKKNKKKEVVALS